jgi:hypothetical protein
LSLTLLRQYDKQGTVIISIWKPSSANNEEVLKARLKIDLIICNN